jgi:hypothetical protein
VNGGHQMITTLIVLGSIFTYFVLGMLICSPALKPLYAAVEDYSRSEYHKITPEAIMRQVIGWYSLIVMLWPLSFVWVMCWVYARPRTPQYRAHIDAEIQKRLQTELTEAQRIIKEFSNRNMPNLPPTASIDQTHFTNPSPYDIVMNRLRKNK